MVPSATDSPARAPLLEPHDGGSFFEAPSAAALTAPISKSAVETPAAATRMLDMVTSSAGVNGARTLPPPSRPAGAGAKTASGRMSPGGAHAAVLPDAYERLCNNCAE